MYQNKHGRFTAPDPFLASARAVNPQTLNRYIYTSNNPVNFVDPLGLMWVRNRSGSIRWEDDDYKLGDGETDVTNSYQECKSDGCGIGGVHYMQGDIVFFGEKRKTTLAMTSEEAAQIAAATGTEVRMTIEEIAETTASMIFDFGFGALQGMAGSACLGQCSTLNPQATDTIPQRAGQILGAGVDFGLGLTALDIGGKGTGAAVVTGQVEVLAVSVPLVATGVVLMVGSTMYASQILEAGMPTHWTSPQNVDRMKQGKAPKDEDGTPVELHHKDQKPDGEVIPMTREDHRGKGNHKKNHPNRGPSKLTPKIRRQDREKYWKKKAKELEQKK